MHLTHLRDVAHQLEKETYKPMHTNNISIEGEA